MNSLIVARFPFLIAGHTGNKVIDPGAPRTVIDSSEILRLLAERIDS
jgi:hypothetical protein